MFHPVQDGWSEHFVWTSDGQWIVGITPIGRATVERLDLNDVRHDEGFIRVSRALWVQGDGIHLCTIQSSQKVQQLYRVGKRGTDQNKDQDMLPELSEHEATGDIACIYADIRTLCAVPYVSSMQRHLATRPGWLEWAWAAMRPVFADGSAQTTAWQVAATLDVTHLPPLSRSALRVLGVDTSGEQAIRTVCDSFIRVSPTNLMFSGILRRLLAGERPHAIQATQTAWTPPAALPELPSLVDLHRLTPEVRQVLFQLGTEVAGQPFVPGLYRMLAHWPAYLAHVATVLGPRFDDPSTRACCQSLLQRLDEAVPGIFARLPTLSENPPMPPRTQCDEVLAGLERYRQTSPQMVVFGALIRNALPESDLR